MVLSVALLQVAMFLQDSLGRKVLEEKEVVEVEGVPAAVSPQGGEMDQMSVAPVQWVGVWEI